MNPRRYTWKNCICSYYRVNNKKTQMRTTPHMFSHTQQSMFDIQKILMLWWIGKCLSIMSYFSWAPWQADKWSSKWTTRKNHWILFFALNDDSWKSGTSYCVSVNVSHQQPISKWQRTKNAILEKLFANYICLLLKCVCTRGLLN